MFSPSAIVQSDSAIELHARLADRTLLDHRSPSPKVELEIQFFSSVELAKERFTPPPDFRGLAGWCSQ
jgi:hypothetical protein